MELLLRGGRVLDPSAGHRAPVAADVRISDGRIAEIGPELAAGAGRAIDVTGLLVTPGFVDLHVHFREPGQEYKEDIETGSRTAAAGGFTTVCPMPNTSPANDSRAITELMVGRGREVGLCRIRPVGAISRGLDGTALAEYGEMKEAGIVAVSDDGKPVMSSGLMRRALEYARTFDLPVVQHAEDLSLAEGGVMNEGEVSTQLGLRGQPPSAESTMIARDLELVEWTGARYHVAHISTARSVELVRQAKARGLPVTCEVTPHHLHLDHSRVIGYDTCCKVSPPLRTAEDVRAMRQALADGTIDCVATDHAPHSSLEKDVEFDLAAFGMTGLETALATVLQLVKEGALDLARAIAVLTSAPAEVFGLAKEGVGSLAVGAPADIAIIDEAAGWVVDRQATFSKSHNNPFHGFELTGRPVATLLAGRPTYDRDGRLS